MQSGAIKEPGRTRSMRARWVRETRAVGSTPRNVTLHVVVHGYDPWQPSVFVALVDSGGLRQIDCEVDWSQAAEAGWVIVDAASRW